MAPNAKFTEQAQVLQVGEGLWKRVGPGGGAYLHDQRGKIHEIEAMGFTLPLYSKNGWSPFVR